jgi:beta-aspartyl-peptidase (threonine type)
MVRAGGQLESDRTARYGRAMSEQAWRLVVHGGAGSMRPGTLDPETERCARAGLEAALAAGSAILGKRESAIDAVEAAVRVLEEDVCFNAGAASVLTASGVIELDAAIMDGRTAAPGRSPDYGRPALRSAWRGSQWNRAARLPVGPRRRRFRARGRLEQVDNHWFETPEGEASSNICLARAGSTTRSSSAPSEPVAVDVDGHVAVATSTGGLTAKRWGRVGDSPLIGAGTYADDRAAAVSATGSGEYFIRAVAAHELTARIRLGASRCSRRSTRARRHSALGGKAG